MTSDDTPTIGRQVAAAVLAAAPLAAIAIAGLTLTPRLGATIASHWAGNATHPNGFSSTSGSFWGFATVTAVLVLVSELAIPMVRRASWSRVWPALGTGVAGLTACAWIVAAWATVDAPRPDEAVLGWRMAILLLALACGALVYLLLPASPAPATGAARHPSMPLRQGDRISWSGVIASRAFEVLIGVLCVVLIGVAIVAATSGEASVWIGVAIFALAVVAVLALVPVRLTVDQRGIRLVSVALRIPLIRVALDNVESVAVDTIDPMRWGGWGYRISGTGVAYVTRRGPGLVIARRSGGAVAITLDNPDQPAAVANALIGHRTRRG